MAPTKGAAGAQPEVLHEPLILPDAVRSALLDAGMAPALKLKLAICASVIALGLAFGTGRWLHFHYVEYMVHHW